MDNNKPILTAGNDFYLRVNVYTRNAQGEREPFNLSACDKWAFFLRNTYGVITETTFGLEEGSLNTILVDCKDIKRSMGYTAEVVAVLNGRNLRCAERGVFAITGYNADANVTFEVYDAEEGQDLDMDFQIVSSAEIVGKNAYELAVEEGYEGTLGDWLADIVHDAEYVHTDNNFTDEHKEAVENMENIPEWALQPTKPTYTAQEVGAPSEQEFEQATDQLQRAISNEASIRSEQGNELYGLISRKQDTLVSGTNIKTVNNQSLLGAGNINIVSDGLQSFEFIECNITAVDGNHEATVDNTNWVNDAVAAYNAKKIPVLFGSVSYGVYYSMQLVVQPYDLGVMTDYKVYGSAAVEIYIGSGDYKQSILYAQSQTTHGGHSIYVTDIQELLVSGQNIKTINGQSIVGSGNLTIPTGLTAAYEVVDAGLLYLDQTETYYEVPATVYTALKAVWDAGKVPVLTGSLNSHTTGFALIPTFDETGERFYCYWHAHNDMNNHRWHLSGTIFSTGGRLYPEEEQKPITVDQSVIAGSTNPVSGAGVKTYVDGIVGDINTILDQINGEVI